MCKFAKETHMLFNSLEFLLFFPLTVAIYFLLPHKLRRYFLLLASVYFYMSFMPKYILIVGFTTVVDYVGARLIDKFSEKNAIKRTVFITGILLNVGLLVLYKYLGVIGDTINFFGAMISLETVVLPELLLPIGISFHTFQSMGYFIDTYTGKVKAERNFIDFALFLMFFPQLVAGPIERFYNLMDQLKIEHRLKSANIIVGGRLMLWGMFKKVVVADSLAVIADAVFDKVEDFSGAGLLIGLLAFTVQIYCDFSGYSDIAIGCAKIMDIDLMKNFDTPYFSASTPEFWRRWHISLSTWFKDYVYIPLGGNRVSKPRWVFNQLFTMTISGIWHGAGYTYIVWGFINGLYIVISRFTKSARDKFRSRVGIDRVPWLSKSVSVLITFVLISFTWIFFRANDFSDAFYFISNIFAPTKLGFSSDIPLFRIIVAIGAALLLLSVEFIAANFKRVKDKFFAMPYPVRAAAFGLLTAVIIICGAYGTNQFIYFQF